MDMKNNSFSNNRAECGGAIYTCISDLDSVEALQVSLSDGTEFVGNSATKSGGAIFAQNIYDMRVVDQSSFDGNQAGIQGGAVSLVSSQEVTRVPQM